MALKLIVIALAWVLAVSDALAPGQFTYKVFFLDQTLDLQEVKPW
jgi:hypothetical protein